MTDHDEQYDDDNPVKAQRDHIKDLERQLAEERRQRAIAEAGIQLNPDQRQALIAVLGESTDADTIREKASALGFVNEPEPEPEQEAPQGQPDSQPVVEAHRRMAEATAASSPPLPAGTAEQAIKDFRDRLYSGDLGSGPQHLSEMQREFERVLRDAGGQVTKGVWDLSSPMEPI